MVDNLPKHWALNVSPNGWTSNEIGVNWLEALYSA